MLLAGNYSLLNQTEATDDHNLSGDRKLLISLSITEYLVKVISRCISPAIFSPLRHSLASSVYVWLPSHSYWCIEIDTILANLHCMHTVLDVNHTFTIFSYFYSKKWHYWQPTFDWSSAESQWLLLLSCADAIMLTTSLLASIEFLLQLTSIPPLQSDVYCKTHEVSRTISRIYKFQVTFSISRISDHLSAPGRLCAFRLNARMLSTSRLGEKSFTKKRIFRNL